MGTEMSRADRRKKEKPKRRGCLKSFIFLLLLLVGIAAFVYFRFDYSFDKIYEDLTNEVDPHDSRSNKVNLSKGDNFNVLLLGIDTGDLGRVDQGRSDSMMVMTVSKTNQQITVTSIPRDSLVPIVGHGTEDKINHAYAFGGPSMSINTVQSFLDVPIDFFVSVNMAGIKQIVDAVGGIDITPQTTFTQDGYTFYEGQPTHMNGEMALQYSRMRKQDGDYARQGRQREVVNEIVRQIASIDGVLNYGEILSSMESNVITNLTTENMATIALNYRKSAGHVVNDQLSGSGTNIDGVYYEIIPQEEVDRVHANIMTQLGLE